jgi:hypothetical protein
MTCKNIKENLLEDINIIDKSNPKLDENCDAQVSIFDNQNNINPIIKTFLDKVFNL